MGERVPAGLEEAVTAAGSRLLVADDFADVVDELVGDARTAVASPRLLEAAPWLTAAVTAAGVRVVAVDPQDPLSAVADVDIGLVRGELIVTETGSVLVDEHDLADRGVSMLTRRLVQVVPASAIVARLEDVATWLSRRPSGAGFASLITGPSRSADIERSLTIGVQGPSEVDVVLLGEVRW